MNLNQIKTVRVLQTNKETGETTYLKATTVPQMMSPDTYNRYQKKLETMLDKNQSGLIYEARIYKWELLPSN